MTNVNPGNRDPRNGRFGGIRKLFGRDKSEDLLQDREDLADDLARDDLAQDDLVEDNRVKRSPAQDHAADRYETAGDGSFDEALDEYYDSRDQAEPAEREVEAPETSPRGKHHRRDEAESDGYGYSHGQEKSDSDGYGYSHGYTAAATEGVDPSAEFEYGDYIDGENNYGYTSKGSERYDEVDDRDDHDDRDDSDDRAVAAASAGAAGAGAATAAGAAGAGTGTGSSTAAAAGGVPKRGLAMILIAVALLLALWGVYAMTKGDSDDQAANDPASQSAQDPNAQNGQAQQGQQNQTQADPNNPNAQQGQEQGQQGQQNQNPNDPNDPNAQNRQPGQGGTQGNGAAPVGANNPMTAENETVNIYNNSAMQDFANRVAAQANEKGMKVGEVGNIPGESAIFEQNTVLYDPATPGAEDRARELADKVGGIALANDDRIPAEAKKPGSLTLVLAENREVAL